MGRAKQDAEGMVVGRVSKAMDAEVFGRETVLKKDGERPRVVDTEEREGRVKAGPELATPMARPDRQMAEVAAVLAAPGVRGSGRGRHSEKTQVEEGHAGEDWRCKGRGRGREKEERGGQRRATERSSDKEREWVSDVFMTVRDIVRDGADGQGGWIEGWRWRWRWRGRAVRGHYIKSGTCKAQV